MWWLWLQGNSEQYRYEETLQGVVQAELARVPRAGGLPSVRGSGPSWGGDEAHFPFLILVTSRRRCGLLS